MVKKKDNWKHNNLAKEYTKLKIEQQELHYKPGVNSCDSEGLAGSAPLMTPILKTRFPSLTVQIYRQTQAVLLGSEVFYFHCL
jgi:hypothetical protein